MPEEAQRVLSPAEAREEEQPTEGSGEAPEGRENGAGGLTGALERVAPFLQPGGTIPWPPSEEFVSDLIVVARSNVPDEPTLPISTLAEALPYLRRPFSPNAVRFKIQAEFGKPPKGGLIVAYVDARTVVERLNYVCGPLWDDRYESVTNDALRCHLTIDGVTRLDVGEGGLTKAGHSDALKRAAVKFGVGVSLYAIPQVRLWAGDGKTKLQLRGDHLVLSDDNMAALRKGYAKWLESEGAKDFGDPLDHGDAVDAIGDPLDPDNPEADPVPEGVDPETGEVKPTGRKIGKDRVAELARLVESAPPWLGKAEVHAKLTELGIPETDDLLERHKALRASQADEYETWLKGLPEEPDVPEVE